MDVTETRQRNRIVQAALFLCLLLAWLNFLTTGRWAHLPGSLNGWKQPYYAAALVVATALAVAYRRRLGGPVRVGMPASAAVTFTGLTLLATVISLRLPIALWGQVPFKDDWTELYQQTVNGVGLLKRGVVVGWNWWFLGGYPSSTDIAQNFSTVAFLPTVLLGDQLGYHVLHVVMFLAVPAFVWWDLRREDRETARVATGLAGVFAAGYLGPLGASGDTNSLVGVCCVVLALAGSRSARLGSRWGGPVLLAALTLAAYTHTAFSVYTAIYLAVEAVYFRDRAAMLRLAAALPIAAIAALPAHWESFRYAAYVSFNNTVYEPGAPRDWFAMARNLYYNVEILAFPHRWYNDYRSLANVWLPALVATAILPGRTRPSFYAWAAVVTQFLLRLNTSEAGAGFDRIQHMMPLLTAPALAGFVLRAAGARPLAGALVVLLGLYVHTDVRPIRHVERLRDFDPPLIDRIAGVEGGSLVLVEISPHRDMDRHPTKRTQTTPFDVHFEGLLPGVAGQRFYSQMIDGWVWNVWRGQVVGAGTFRGQPIADTPPDAFVAEMRRWNVRHLFVWTDETRQYLARDSRFVERWRSGRWSHFEQPDATGGSIVAPNGSGNLRNLDWLGADVDLTGVKAGDEIVIRANYYPAWRASHRDAPVDLYARDGLMAFRAPADGSYTVALRYPRYRALNAGAMLVLIAGMVVLARWPRRAPDTGPQRGTAAGRPPEAG